MVAAVAVISMLVIGTSQPPAPSTAKPDTQAQQEPADTKAPTTKDRRGTDESPLAVRVLPAPADQKQAAQEQRDRQRDTAIKWWTIGLAALTVLIGFGQIWMINKQANIAAQQNMILENQTGIMDSQRGMQNDMLALNKTIERAYLDIRDWQIKDRSDGKKLVGFNIRNTGRTPAHIHGSLLKWRIDSAFLPDAHYDGTAPVNPLMISQGGNSLSFAAFGPLSAPQQQALDTGQAKLFFWGTIAYADAFQTLHHRHFAVTFSQLDGAWYAPEGGRNDEED